MSKLFKSPKAPAPDPEIVAAQKRQEKRIEQEEAAKLRAIAARNRVRRYGGRRQLLSKQRPMPQQGIGG